MIKSEVEKIISLARDKYTVHECGECTYRKCCELGFGSAECLSRRVSISLMLGIEDSFFTKLLDDIEAAAKLDSSPTGERLSTVGAETCEALEDIFLICCKAGSAIGYDVACGCIKSKARHALSSLARNFDMSAYAESVRQAWLEDEKNWDELGSPKLELHEWILSRGTERRDADDENL